MTSFATRWSVPVSFRAAGVSANDFEKASAGLRQLGIQLQANRNKLDYTKLYVPTDGYVQQVNFSPAEMVDAGTALRRCSMFRAWRSKSTFQPVNTSGRDRFTHFTCRAAGIEGEIPLRLSGLPPKADGNQLYHLTLDFAAQPDRQLTAGMNVEVRITESDTTRRRGFSVPLGSRIPGRRDPQRVGPRGRLDPAAPGCRSRQYRYRRTRCCPRRARRRRTDCTGRRVGPSKRVRRCALWRLRSQTNVGGVL